MNYVRTLKRIREKKTNYHKRASILLSKKSFVTIKISNQNTSTQIIRPIINGDDVLISTHSKNLANFGWKGSLSSMPACYLTGYLLGKKAMNNGINDAILYTGNNKFTTKIASCLKGILDSGLQIPTSKDALPPMERITGQHISNYGMLLKEKPEGHGRQFSRIIKNGLNPEDYVKHFNETKELIDKELSNKFDSKGSNNQ